MPDIVESKTDNRGTVTTTWWKSALTPQFVIGLIGVFIGVVIFWKDSKDNWEKVKQHDQIISTKADKAETAAQIKSTDDKVNRQYETNNQIRERIIAIEKELEYQRGVHDATEKQQNKK